MEAAVFSRCTAACCLKQATTLGHRQGDHAGDDAPFLPPWHPPAHAPGWGLPCVTSLHVTMASKKPSSRPTADSDLVTCGQLPPVAMAMGRPAGAAAARAAAGRRERVRGSKDGIQRTNIQIAASNFQPGMQASGGSAADLCPLLGSILAHPWPWPHAQWPSRSPPPWCPPPARGTCARPGRSSSAGAFKPLLLSSTNIQPKTHTGQPAGPRRPKAAWPSRGPFRSQLGLALHRLGNVDVLQALLLAQQLQDGGAGLARQRQQLLDRQSKLKLPGELRHGAGGGSRRLAGQHGGEAHRQEAALSS